MTTYEVGQIIYLIQPKKLAVVPVQVVEQIIKRTAEGEDIIYNVQPPNSSTLVTLNSFDGEIFNDLSSVKNYLMDNAQKSIDSLVDKTKESVETNFGVTLKNKVSNSKRRRGRPKKSAPSDMVQIDLGDGQVGNIKITDELQKMVP